MATRHQVRQCVVSMLYAAQMGGECGDFAEFLDEQRVRNEQRRWCFALFDGVRAHAGELDALCDEFLQKWKMSEIGAVEQCILRLGAYEIRHTPTDKAIVVSEAVALANELVSEASARMINGVLDKL